jgi:uncharacterized protein YndB with AHSA1/START domain
MPKFSISTKLAVPADAVWQIVSQFDGLPDWHPAVESSEVEPAPGGGTLRRIKLAGGTIVVERLTQLDESGRVFGYEVLEGPPPFKNHRARFRVKDADEGCEVEWTAEFEGIGPVAALGGGGTDLMGAMRAMFESGLDALKKMFGG